MCQVQFNGSLNICEKYFKTISDHCVYFLQVFANEQEKAGFRLLDAKLFPPSLQQIAPTDKLSIEFSNIDSGWQVLEDSDCLKQVTAIYMI